MNRKSLRPFLAVVILLSTLGFAVDAHAEGSTAQRTFQAAPMFDFSNPAILLPGAATLNRANDEIAFRVYTEGLAPGATTIWIIIFNDPDACAGGPGGCVGADLLNPAVQGSIVYGTGATVGADGIGNFHGSLGDGSPPAGISVNVPIGMANGLKNAQKAEIHLVVRGHGPAIAGQAVAQYTTFELVCGLCADQQAVVFPPVQ